MEEEGGGMMSMARPALLTPIRPSTSEKTRERSASSAELQAMTAEDIQCHKPKFLVSRPTSINETCEILRGRCHYTIERPTVDHGRGVLLSV